MCFTFHLSIITFISLWHLYKRSIWRWNNSCHLREVYLYWLPWSPELLVVKLRFDLVSRFLIQNDWVLWHNVFHFLLVTSFQNKFLYAFLMASLSDSNFQNPSLQMLPKEIALWSYRIYIEPSIFADGRWMVRGRFSADIYSCLPTAKAVISNRERKFDPCSLTWRICLSFGDHCGESTNWGI